MLFLYGPLSAGESLFGLSVFLFIALPATRPWPPSPRAHVRALLLRHHSQGVHRRRVSCRLWYAGAAMSDAYTAAAAVLHVMPAAARARLHVPRRAIQLFASALCSGIAIIDYVDILFSNARCCEGLTRDDFLIFYFFILFVCCLLYSSLRVGNARGGMRAVIRTSTADCHCVLRLVVHAGGRGASAHSFWALARSGHSRRQ